MPDIVQKYFGPMPKYEAGPIVLILTFAVCITSWNFFEKPISGLKRYFWNAPLKRPPAPMEPVTRVSRSDKSSGDVRVF
jgi:peptidoglycan/LPS O-acetylase OafA/YrhL